MSCVCRRLGMLCSHRAHLQCLEPRMSSRADAPRIGGLVPQLTRGLSLISRPVHRYLMKIAQRAEAGGKISGVASYLNRYDLCPQPEGDVGAQTSANVSSFLDSFSPSHTCSVRRSDQVRLPCSASKATVWDVYRALSGAEMPFFLSLLYVLLACYDSFSMPKYKSSALHTRRLP